MTFHDGVGGYFRINIEEKDGECIPPAPAPKPAPKPSPLPAPLPASLLQLNHLLLLHQ